MTRPLLVALLALAGPAAAQTFPAPGTGPYTWERVGNRPLNSPSFAFAPDGRVYAGSDSFYVFEPAPDGPPAGRWRALGRPGGVLTTVHALGTGADTVLVGNGNGVAIARSVNRGATWALVNYDESDPIGGPRTPDGFFAIPPAHVHAGRLLAGGGVLFSDDRGATWAEAARAFPGEPGYAHVFASLPSGRVLMAGEWGVAGSDDGGAGYAVSPLYQDGRYQLDGLAALATPGSAQAGPPACDLADGALCDGAVVVGTDAEAGPDVRAWRSNDGGRTWSGPVVLPQPVDGVGSSSVAGVVAVGAGPDGLGRAVAVLGRGLVYTTRDGGQTWAAVGRLPVVLGGASHSARLVRLGPDGHLWVSTLRNGSSLEWLYRSAEPAEAAFVVAGESGPTGAPSAGVSVRPNPAGGRVEVVLSHAGGGPVRVVVLDALGREVAVLLDGEAADERTVAVDVSGWPTGVYVVRATAGDRVETTRLTVVRR
ncbi:MAG TPA: T9SS type A sorting domain-containing protein [Rubricoccaceae bacterium]|jgi:hypothetical protein